MTFVVLILVTAFIPASKVVEEKANKISSNDCYITQIERAYNYKFSNKLQKFVMDLETLKAYTFSDLEYQKEDCLDPKRVEGFFDNMGKDLLNLIEE